MPGVAGGVGAEITEAIMDAAGAEIAEGQLEIGPVGTAWPSPATPVADTCS